MPIYDLSCVDCGHKQTDISMSVAGYGKATCPKCGGKMQSISFCGFFSLRGDGWTPTLTGIDRQRTREDVFAESIEMTREMDRINYAKKEAEKKIYLDCSR